MRNLMLNVPKLIRSIASTSTPTLNVLLCCRFPLAHYSTSASLISNLSSYSPLRKSWKKEIFELLLEQNFFTFAKECLPFWRVTFDNLFTQDKYTFTELLGKASFKYSIVKLQFI
jgi:hypothetical protein